MPTPEHGTRLPLRRLGGRPVRRRSREHQRTDTSVRVHGQATVSAEEASLLGHVGEALSQEGRASPMDTMTAAYGGVVMLSNRVEDESTWVMKRTMPMGDEQRTWDLHHLGDLRLEDGLSLVVGTGINAPTTHMVAGVASRRASDPGIDEALQAIAGLVHRGLEALKTGDSGLGPNDDREPSPPAPHRRVAPETGGPGLGGLADALGAS